MRNNPIKQLNEDDLNRKEIKMNKILRQIDDPTTSSGKLKRLAEKKRKTKYQLDTGKRGKPITIKNENWLAGK